MRKILCILLAMLMLLTACGSEPAEPTTVPTTEPTTQTTTTETTEATEPTESTESTDPQPDDLEELRENFPKIDGSTSLIPLEAGIRAALFGKTIEEATEDVAHSTTWGSFYNLLDGSVDMILSCNLSDMQLEQAAYENVELELVPIAREGFIFVVNAENPVDSLTQQQLRDIYTGKITNWKEVGGLNEEIIPYQRNTTSGSQNYMNAFMEGYDLLDAPMEMRPDSMAGLLDVIAVNDNSRASIGYSVYAYAAHMYGNGNEIKFIKVDSVAPSKTSFADGRYPLLGENYAVFRADEPADSPVRKLVEWCQSYDGQLAIAQAGYVTMRDIGFDYEEMRLVKYTGTGTGPAPAEASDIVYKLSVDNPDLVFEVVPASNGMQTYRIRGLQNKVLLSEVNAYIEEQLADWAWDAALTVQNRVNTLNADNEYGEYEMGLWNCTLTALPVSVNLTCTNGYFSVAVCVGYTRAVQEGTSHYYRTDTANWNLFTGKRLTPEDLFCAGVDVDTVLSNYLQKASQSPVKPFGSELPELKCDFAGLPTTGWHLTNDGIYIDEDNPYFSRGYYFPLDLLSADTLSSRAGRDFASELEANGILQCYSELNLTGVALDYAYNQDGFVSCAFLADNRYPTAEKINAQVMDYLNSYYSEEAIRAEFLAQCGTDPELWFMDWSAYCIADRYILFQGSKPECYLGNDTWYTYSKPAYLLFDLSDGEQIAATALLKEGWQDNIANISPPYGIDKDLLSIENAQQIELWPHSYNELTVFVVDELGDWFLYVPMEYLAIN